MEKIFIFSCIVCIFVYVPTIYAIKCWECQDVPPLMKNCTKMIEEGRVLTDCTSQWDGCNTIVVRIYNETSLLRSCGMDYCEIMMNIALPKEVFISCQTCYEDGCNDVIG